MIPISKHIAFYQHQIQAEETEWKKYANTHLNILISDKKLFIGRIWGVSETQGNVILRFKSDKHFYRFGNKNTFELLEIKNLNMEKIKKKIIKK